MPRPSDERLIAYLDGELDERERAEIADALEHDGELRDRARRLTESAALLRAAFDEVVREPLPERLIAAARGEGGKGREPRHAGKARRDWAAALVGRHCRGGIDPGARHRRRRRIFRRRRAGRDRGAAGAGEPRLELAGSTTSRDITSYSSMPGRTTCRLPTCRPTTATRARSRRSCRPISGCRT